MRSLRGRPGGGARPARGRRRSCSIRRAPARARAVLEALAAVSRAQLVYVACDPIAFARDVATLAGLGYRLEALRALDLFPHTHHVEAVGALVRG